MGVKERRQNIEMLVAALSDAERPRRPETWVEPCSKPARHKIKSFRICAKLTFKYGGKSIRKDLQSFGNFPCLKLTFKNDRQTPPHLCPKPDHVQVH